MPTETIDPTDVAVLDKNRIVTGDNTSACGGDVQADKGDPMASLPDLGEDLLAGIQATDLDLLTKAPDFSVESDEFKDIKEPHWLFDTQHLFDRVKALSVIVKDRQELVPRCVHLEPIPGGVMFRVNTSEAIAEVKVDLVNTTLSLQHGFIVDFKVLFSVIRNSGSKILIRFNEKTKSPTVTVLGGEVEFENYNLDPMLFKNPDFLSTEKLQRLEGGLFNRFVSRGVGAMALATRPEDRRVRIEGGMALSNFMSSLFVQKGLEIQEASFRAIDLVFLRQLFEGIPELFFRTAAKHYIFVSAWAKIALPKIDTLDLSSVKTIVEAVKMSETFSVSPTHFYKVVSLVRNMIGNTGIVKLVPESGKLVLRATTKTSKLLQFPVATAPNEVKFAISSPVSSLVSTAVMFRKDAVVQVAVDDRNRMIFAGEGMEVILGSIIE